LLAALAQDVEARFGEQEILQLELKDLARAQAVLQHESDNGEIAEGAKAFPEAGDLVCGEGHDHWARLLQSQIGRNLGLPATVAERRASGIPALKKRLAGNLLCVMEAIQAAQHTQAVIDGLRSG
jgi:hypothetical protein